VTLEDVSVGEVVANAWLPTPPQAMSQENVEIVRASFEAWNAGDMDALRELHDPDVILRTPRVGRSRDLS
jgi:predicted lipid-binding transport protein (Tim44 family)